MCAPYEYRIIGRTYRLSRMCKDATWGGCTLVEICSASGYERFHSHSLSLSYSPSIMYPVRISDRFCLEPRHELPSTLSKKRGLYIQAPFSAESCPEN